VHDFVASSQVSSEHGLCVSHTVVGEGAQQLATQIGGLHQVPPVQSAFATQGIAQATTPASPPSEGAASAPASSSGHTPLLLHWWSKQQDPAAQSSSALHW
jgi:hypothetical protein